MHDVKVTVIDDCKEVKRIYKILMDKRNYIEDTSYRAQDFRISFVFFKGDTTVETICWSNVQRIVVNERCYMYSKEIENLLLSMKLIYDIK